MRRTAKTRKLKLLNSVCILVTLLPGCVHPIQRSRPHKIVRPHYIGAPACDATCPLSAMEIEYPDVQRCGLTEDLDALPPREMSDGIPTEFWDMPLQEAIQIALQNGKVLKDLGGRVLTAPQSVGTVYDPSIQFTHPRLGEAAALAAFDAQWAQAFTYRDGTRIFNNRTLGGGAARINQDLFRAESQLTKTAAAGTQVQLRSFVESNHNDIGIPPNLFSHAWKAGVEANVRQPLLRGGGIAFNRIAGPQSSVDLSLTPGVVIARIASDVTLAEFERGVRDFLNEVETAYWQLYLSYRVLDANRISRDSARKTWQAIEARFQAGMEGGGAGQEAQAREQVYFFEEQVLTALNTTSLGGQTGVYQAERQLRRLLGLPVTASALIRPADEPTEARVVFDWDECVADALVRRVELRQQMWRVKQRELEIIAAKNFLLPQLDAVAAYRAEGLGDDLIGGLSALSDLWNFNNDEVEAGLQLSVPIGFRRELAGLRHSQLNLCRERALLHDQEHAITLALADAIVELDTAYASIGLNQSRLQAAEDAVNSQLAVLEAGRLPINFLLEAQRRFADSRINYYRSRVGHVLSLLAVHREKGTLLGYNGIMLNEGSWCHLACRSHEEYQRRHKHKLLDYRCQIPGCVTQGDISHEIDNSGTSVPPLLPEDLKIQQVPAGGDAPPQRPLELLPPVSEDAGPVSESRSPSQGRLPELDTPSIDDAAPFDLPQRLPLPQLEDESDPFREAAYHAPPATDHAVQQIPSSVAPLKDHEPIELTGWLEPAPEDPRTMGCFPEDATGDSQK